MRIIEVRFKNLNSLAGEWKINFSDPAFVSDGIFLISGPTGAGKTTVLDAVCLALYGRTPRLDRVTKSENGIMSRQCGECFAEVVFETDRGRYRCTWSQHRARKKADGDLQQSRHEISDAITGTIVEDRQRDVARKIEEKTGLDFEQFTRSMLLAQGGFAAFLQASPDERSPILEQITGTDIYSQISIRVHEMNREKGDRLKELKAALEGIQVFEDEEEQRLREDLDHQVQQEKGLEQQIAQNSAALSWLEGMAALEKELAALEVRRGQWAARWKDFEPHLERLEKAARALDLAAEYTRLESLRHAQKEDRSALGENCREQTALEQSMEGARKTFSEAEERLSQRKTDLVKALQDIRIVRAMDVTLSEKTQAADNSRIACESKEKDLEALEKDREDTRRQHEACSGERDGMSLFLQQHQADEGLIAEMASIERQCGSLQVSNARSETLAAACTAARTRHDRAVKASRGLQAALEKKKKAHRTHLDAFESAQQSHEKILDGRKGSEWRAERDSLKERKVLLQEMEQLVQDIDRNRLAEQDFDRQRKMRVEEREMLGRGIEEMEQKRSVCGAEVEGLERKFLEYNGITELGEWRPRLQDGVPCPLCGAKDHPYARGNVPAVDKVRAVLEKKRLELRKIDEDLSGVRIRESEAYLSLKEMERRLRECRDLHNTWYGRMEEAFRTLEITAADEHARESIHGLQQHCNEELLRITKLIDEAEGIERELASCRSLRDQSLDELHHAGQEALAGSHQMEMAEKESERAEKERADHEERMRDMLHEALRNVAPYGISDLPMGEIPEIVKELKERRDRWQCCQKKKEEQEKRLNALAMEIRHREEQIEIARQDLKGRQDAFAALSWEQEKLTAERRALFGDKNTDSEERRFSEAADKAEKERDRTREFLHDAEKSLGKVKNRIEELEKALQSRQAPMADMEAAFTSRLAGKAFSSEDDYRAASMGEEDRVALLNREKSLREEQRSLEELCRDRTALRESEQKKHLTDWSDEFHRQQQESLAGELKGLRQQVGAITQRLKDNAVLRGKKEAQIKAVDAQRLECSRWEELHGLIGSSDGKKFRNFAQGLTFEIMLGHANMQLSRMTDRYLLTRSARDPLELFVIDNYQAALIRSTRNLSGGESFIVSLSLALGLSQMASRKVRVDSLFLDEGFGTLDEEALEMALASLSGLRQTGKTIGVISHVAALKERISTQIRVIPLTGGRSELRGPGCRRVEK